MTLLDDKLDNETDIMGIDPKNLGSFTITARKVCWVTRELSSHEHASRLAAAKQASRAMIPCEKSGGAAVVAKSEMKHLWDAKNVDEDTFKEDGITQSIA